MTNNLTQKVLDFLRWRSQEEHQAGMHAIKLVAYRKRKRILDEEKEEIMRDGQAALQHNWDVGQNDIVFHIDTGYVNHENQN